MWKTGEIYCSKFSSTRCRTGKISGGQQKKKNSQRQKHKLKNTVGFQRAKEHQHSENTPEQQIPTHIANRRRLFYPLPGKNNQKHQKSP